LTWYDAARAKELHERALAIEEAAYGADHAYVIQRITMGTIEPKYDKDIFKLAQNGGGGRVLTSSAVCFAVVCCMVRAGPVEVAALVYAALVVAGVVLHVSAGPIRDEPPFWGAPTTPLDECEENFALTPLVGELWSAAADLVVLGVALAGWRWAWRGAVRRNGGTGATAEARLLFGALAFVGACSLIYHTTLSADAMVWDVVSVAWLALLLVWVARAHTQCRVDPVARAAPLRASAWPLLLPRLDGLSVVGFATFSSLGFMELPEQLVIYPCVSWAAVCVLRLVRPFLGQQFCGSAAAVAVRRLLVRSAMLALLALACLIVDRIRCDEQTRPLRLHAWWHALSACSVHALITLCCLVIESERAAWQAAAVGGGGGVNVILGKSRA
jgi:hypothetical protein